MERDGFLREMGVHYKTGVRAQRRKDQTDVSKIVVGWW